MVFVALIVLLIASAGLVAKKVERAWTAPAGFFAWLWAGYVLASLVFLPDPNSLIFGTLWIALGAWAVCLGSLTASELRLDSRLPSGSLTAGSPQLPQLRHAVLALVLVGFVETAYIFAKRNMSITSMFSFSAVAEVSAINRIEYVYGELRPDVVEWILYVLTYTSALFGGVWFYLAPTRIGKAVGALPLFFVSFFSTLYGSRMGVLFGGSFWISSYVATQVLSTSGTRQPKALFPLKIGILAVSIILGLSVVAQVIRYTYLTESQDVNKYVTNSFGFVAAFCQWFETEYTDQADLLWGYRTFWKAYEFIGIPGDPEGDIDLGFTTSNIYTFQRGIIEDFGLLGSLAWLFGLGFLGHWSYRRVAQGSVGFLPVLITVYAYMLVGTSFSLFAYNATTLALLLFFGYFLYVSLLRRITAPVRTPNPPGSLMAGPEVSRG